MLRHRVVNALVAFVSFWVMYAVFSLLGGQLDLTIALIFAVASLAVAVVVKGRRTRGDARPGEPVGPRSV